VCAAATAATATTFRGRTAGMGRSAAIRTSAAYPGESCGHPANPAGTPSVAHSVTACAAGRTAGTRAAATTTATRLGGNSGAASRIAGYSGRTAGAPGHAYALALRAIAAITERIGRLTG
jgi:hypothetical protein